MGNLSEDMTRLRGEVDALRGARGALMNDLTRGARDLTTAVAALRADFTSTQAAMAKQTRGERQSFVTAVIDEVNSLLGAFSRDRDDRARKGRQDRGVFLSEMRSQVAGLRQETADDLMGARLAWRGPSPGKTRPVPLKKEPAVVKPLSPPMEAALKKTAAAPEIAAEKPPVAFKEPLKKEEEKKKPAAPEIKAERPPFTFKEPLKREEEKKMAAGSEAPAVETPKFKAPPSVSASKPFQKSKDWMKSPPKR